MPLLKYILYASASVALFYLTYRIISLKTMNFRHARIYLLLSICLSLLIPLSDYRIETGLSSHKVKSAVITHYDVSSTDEAVTSTRHASIEQNEETKADLLHIAWSIYLFVASLLIIRMILMLSVLVKEFITSIKVYREDYVLLYNHRFRHTISFFRWIFVNPACTEEELEQIIAHERIHVSQWHSFDIVLIELIAAVMWFNPFVWMMKSSLQLVHEYLADEGALDTGINRIKYQVLLINQIAEERLIALSSSFNNSLIKKRITMMSHSPIQKKSIIRLLAVLPAAFLIFMLTALFNGFFTENAQASGPEMFSVINKANGLPNSLPSLPPDTVFKKTIIKKISSANPADTLIEEIEEIITGDDVSKEMEIIWHTSDKKHHAIIDTVHTGKVDRHEFRVFVESGKATDSKSHSGYFYQTTDTCVVVKEFRQDGDTVKHVKVIKHNDDDDVVEIKHDKKVIIRHSSDGDSDVLYIIDGKELTGRDAIKSINADEIDTISVLKGDKARQYSDKGYEAVFVITTKSNRKK